MRLQRLFSKKGEAELAAALGRRPLIAFDFDGVFCHDTPFAHTDAVEEEVVDVLQEYRTLNDLARIESRFCKN